MRKHIAYFLILTTLLIMLVTAASCRDEIEMPVYDYGLVGEDVTVEVPVTLPAMDIESRAELSQTQLNTVNSLWIRTYSTNGEATSPWYKVTETSQDNEPATHSYNIRSKSGPSYIVAVANVENMGVARTDLDNQRPLSELLEEADTWAKFLDIAVVSPSTDHDVNAAPVPVTMSGCYSTDPIGAPDIHPRPDAWADRGFKSVFIPAANNELVKLDPADGVIHLRRVVSHITFNLKAGEKVKITPQSYTVVNVPVYTWLYEHDPAQQQAANPGDLCAKEGDAGKYYVTPPLYTSQYFKDVTDDGSCSFDFWQGENKHNALESANCDSYSKREKEAKTKGSATQPDGRNTGLYTSLTGETWTPNNMASYVVVHCDVEYRDPLTVDPDGQLDENGSTVTRTGDAKFVIHLGFLNNNPADFNCYRNVDYTYNVTINGVDDIRVEAFGEETVPGVEGLVSDVEHSTIKLDCHYNAFNINLTRQELTNNFDYLITTWDYGQRKEFSKKNPPKTVADDQYIGWIELRPTTGEETLAEYKPRTGTHADGKTFTLQDAAEAYTWAENDERFSESGWYTVFVAEYTYEDDPDERTNSSTPNWQRYINQNDRWFHIRVVRSISDDNESSYARSKYAIAQSSIQTYYSDRVFTPAEGEISAATAIGVERVNETEGLNLRSSLTYTNNIGVIAGTTSDATNGRFNVWTWIDSRPKTDDGVLWTKLVETDKVMKIKAVPEGDNQNGPIIYAHTAPLAKLVNFDGYINPEQRNDDPQRNSNDPEDFIEAIAACMSRNRDNNGNGVIDKDELRWYVPATGKYLRMVLGSNSIVPLMNYGSLTKQELPHAQNNWNTRYLYYTSDGRVLWAMEGLSTSMYLQWSNPPWQVRCIRNLGSNLTEITRGEKVAFAYERDKANPRQINMSYYDMNNIRAKRFSGNGDGTDNMPVHLITDEYNTMYKSFEYWESVDRYTFTADVWNNKGSNVATFQLITDFFNTNPCKIHDTPEKSGWRIPNIKELAIMRNLGGAFDGYSGEYLYSCSVSYFDYSNKNGGNYQPGKHRFMATRPDGLTQLDAVYNYQTIAYRCVRDVD